MPINDNFKERALGFKRRHDVLKGEICGLILYELKGINLAEGYVSRVFEGAHENSKYRFAIGNDVKGLISKLNCGSNCREMFSVDQSDTPETLVVLEIDTGVFFSSHDYHLRETEVIDVVYRDEWMCLVDPKKICSEVQSLLVSSISSVFSEKDRSVQLKKNEGIFLGKKENEYFWLTHIDLKADFEISRSLTAEVLEELVFKSIELQRKLSIKSAYKFNAGMNGDTSTYTYLNYFQAVENEIKRVAKRIKKADWQRNLLSSESVSNIEAKKELTLREQFAHCSYLIWKDTSDENIEEFNKFYDRRCDLTHPEMVDAPTEKEVSEIEAFSKKILKKNIENSD